jgi:hypothetical protein
MRAKLALRVAASCWYIFDSGRGAALAGLFDLRQQRHRSVLRHDGIDRPARRERLAPAHGPAGDGHNLESGGFQFTQSLQRIGGDFPFGGQCVVDVGEDAGDLRTLGERPG